MSLAIAANPDDVRRLTIKRNSVAVVTDGSAVLGLGNVGPYAAMPVMEGKAALFKRFAGIDAWPLCLDTQDTDEIVRTVQIIAPAFGGINLEDISAPRCFEVERRLRELLDIPVFHDDQHGTAIVVLAALTNALRVVGKKLASVRDRHGRCRRRRDRGAQAAARLRRVRRHRLRRQGRRPRGPARGWARACNGSPSTPTPAATPVTWPARCPARTCSSACPCRTSSPARTSRRWRRTRSSSRSPTPIPRWIPDAAGEYAAVVATGRSDYPNQINNVLAFPGVFRGLLDAQSRAVTDDMLVAAARALAGVVSPAELGPHYIIPSVFHPDVASAVAAAVRDAAGGRHR